VNLRLLTDENIDADVISGVLRRGADIEFERVQAAGLMGAADPEVLEWAAVNKYILLTRDRKTMPRYALERLRSNLPMGGLFVVPPEASLGDVIDELVRIADCSSLSDWNGEIVYLPFFR
jgi:hypothetical protein